MKSDTTNYTVTVTYNPPGFHPITVTVRIGRKNFLDEFNGTSLKPLLKLAMQAIADA